MEKQRRQRRRRRKKKKNAFPLSADYGNFNFSIFLVHTLGMCCAPFFAFRWLHNMKPSNIQLTRS